MTTIRLTFAAGRYHATPWGRHVNEGVAEWPPSPYRLLRALYDVWQRKCFDLPEVAVKSLLEALSTSPPRYVLPFAVASHTRSYLNANQKDPTDKNLVFDPFVVFDRPHACYLLWPELEMTTEDKDALGLLLRNLNYLGRSESWVEADLWEGAVEGPVEAFSSDIAVPKCELERVACATKPQSYQGPGPWIQALTYSTVDLAKERASSPPLLDQVRYAIPKNAVSLNPQRRTASRTPRVEAVLLALDSTVLPLVTATIEVAEQVRTRLMGSHKRRMDGNESKVSPLFSGKTESGGKRLDHGHLYILPRSNDGHRINTILLVSRKGAFREDELDAVRGVRELWQSDGRPKVQCVTTWQGTLAASEPAPFQFSRLVESSAPFVPPRHWRKGRDWAEFLTEEVRRECRNHGIEQTPARVETVRMHSLFDVCEYRRNRKGDPVRPGYALRLTFENAVRVPFAIGYGAHFGLGQFEAAG
jgi:CRISPR-associated protein Csb2